MDTHSRRSFLKLACAGTGLLALAPYSSFLLAENRQAMPFGNAFVVPPLDQGLRQGKQVRFVLNMQQGKMAFLPGMETPTLGINAPYSGPVLHARKGDDVSLQVNNRTEEASILHWHGFRLPAVMDGGPHQSIPPGGSWTARFEVRQDASTCWYHSHQHNQTGQQVYRGLAGMFIIDDDRIGTLDIPSRYGVDDLPVIIQDRDFNADGSFRYISMMPERMHGKHGSTILVNGVVTPTLQAQSTLLRLRVLNGSNARIYKLAFHDNRAFQVIASDGGFLPQAATVRQLVLAPGERAELLVDVADRKAIVLKSLRGAIVANDGMMGGMMARMMGNMGFDQELDILRIDASQAETSSHRRPQALIRPTLLNPRDARLSRTIQISMGMMGGGMMMGGMMNRRGGGMDGMFTINGKAFDMDRIDFEAKRDTPEIWEVSNDSPMQHPFHIHNVQFQILERNGRGVAAHETGLKDTVLVNPNETVRLLMVFQHYSDGHTPYMYHCHNLEHEDQGMMGQFVVV
ncbi:MAG: multicopper oxidase domain-containing protein [Gammaproteobacteria bacterium]|nr:multicopper oxidase domain-containing protein [Gammaproteobacteria bacterium]MBU1724273.1 multicopper oxidase domain-containing protein [Gammaproteobacteria bacterium]MBU2006299.1 multicopper oxidase domain-containing protein [Gammaproteobacteria bacterium]